MSNSEGASRRWALITGCGGGIGQAIARKLASTAINIVTCARAENAAFNDFLVSLQHESNVQVVPLYFDLRESARFAKIAHDLHEKGIELEILVNNAGIAHGGMLLTTPLSLVREVFEVNYFAPIALIQTLGRGMVGRRRGSIVNITSIAGADPRPGNVAYGSSKAALAYTTRMLAQELGPFNIRVNAVAPGLTRTAMADRMETRARARMLEDSSMHREAEPKEIAELVSFLASDNARFINGQVIRIDGGMP